MIECQSQSSSSDEDFLQPIAKFFPPNNLLTKDYSPDEKPILRLIKPDDPFRLTCNELKKLYNNNFFTPEDNLGHRYATPLTASNIIYLKFNNEKYLSLSRKNSTFRFLSGLFLPVEKILSQQVRMSKNVYRTLPQIEFVQYKNNAVESFGNNCKGGAGRDCRFSSNFQSGNLFIAMKKKQFQYDLILQNDINSKGNTQWFHFAVEFNREGHYKFNILNFTKSYSLYETGMRILYSSHRDSEAIGKTTWSKGCKNIKYFSSSVHREDSDNRRYYCLSWEYQCSYFNDKVVFSSGYPYSSLDLERFFKKVVYRKISIHMKMQRVKICESLSGLPIYAYIVQHKRFQRLDNQTITFESSNKSVKKKPHYLTTKENQAIVFLGRQHSGQTQSSFVIEGVVDFLMDNGENDYLKKNFIFVIIPLINVDGVLYGNYRTNLAGADLNRVWRFPNKQLHPEVYFVKKYLQNINKIASISLIIDVHGHSKLLNSFFYGNPQRKDIPFGNMDDPRLFPYICSKRIKQVSFNKSTFSISENKKNSARVVLAEIFPKALVYTFQNSFYGWKKDVNLIQQYSIEIFRKIGRDLILTFLEFDRISDKNSQIKQKWIREIQQLKNRKNSNQTNLDDSDSEAQFQLINILNEQKEQYKKQEQQLSIFNANLEQKSLLRKSTTENMNKSLNFLQRNLVDKRKKNFLRNGVNQIHSEPVSHESQSPKQKNNPSFNTSYSHGFLSIVKIKPNHENNFPSEHRNLNSTSSTHQGRHFAYNLKQEFEPPHQKFDQKQWAIEKLKKKKIKIEQAMNSCSGMKSFLRAMGIPLQKKNV